MIKSSNQPTAPLSALLGHLGRRQLSIPEAPFSVPAPAFIFQLDSWSGGDLQLNLPWRARLWCPLQLPTKIICIWARGDLLYTHSIVNHRMVWVSRDLKNNLVCYISNTRGGNAGESWLFRVPHATGTQAPLLAGQELLQGLLLELGRWSWNVLSYTLCGSFLQWVSCSCLLREKCVSGKILVLLGVIINKY